jgi:UDP-2-acetamido-3-amino-2,3-dideoxy-glucuronate N-acetyltransferase
MAVFDDTRPWEDKLLLYPHEIRWEKGIPVPAKAEPEKVEIPQAEPLKQECAHFLECIQTGQTPRTDGREGLAVLEILNQAQRSLDGSGQRTEHLPATPALRQADRGQITGAFVHDTAVIDENVEVGKGTKIWHFSHILKNSRIGENCTIGKFVEIGPDVNIGKGCKIQNNVSVYKGVTLEDYVFCGPSMVFTNIFNPRAAIRKMDQVRPTLVRRHASLGANCTIICGVTIGSYAFIGAGAVVTRDVSDYALVVGNPARQVGYVCACGVRLPEDLVCRECNSRYRLDKDELAPADKDMVV